MAIINLFSKRSQGSGHQLRILREIAVYFIGINKCQLHRQSAKNAFQLLQGQCSRGKMNLCRIVLRSILTRHIQRILFFCRICPHRNILQPGITEFWKIRINTLPVRKRKRLFRPWVQKCLFLPDHFTQLLHKIQRKAAKCRRDLGVRCHPQRPQTPAQLTILIPEIIPWPFDPVSLQSHNDQLVLLIVVAAQRRKIFQHLLDPDSV